MSLHLTLGTLARRRVIQVSIAGAQEGSDAEWTLLALCDDSTIWWSDLASDGGWHRLEAVPGTETEVPE